MQNRLILQEIAKVITSEEIGFPELTNTIKKYKNLLLEVSNIDLQKQEFRSDLQLNNGKAIGLTWAAMCVDDLLRTQQFIKGIFEAVKQLQKVQHRPIHILYAGTGPFATLILPVLASYSPADLQVTLIEINKHSFDVLKKVIHQLHLNEYVRNLLHEDATTYQIPKGEKIDILLSETMQRALAEEQQVSIVINLANQIDNDFILIPEKIVLELGLLNTNRMVTGGEKSEYYKKIAEVFELSARQIERWPVLNIEKEPDFQFPKVSIPLKDSFDDDYPELAILTRIHVFGDYRIEANESGLTVPLHMEDLARARSRNLQLTLQYQMDTIPGLRWKLETLPD